MEDHSTEMINFRDGWAVFAMIFLAEFGDRTFFVAMMLATKFNANAVYGGCMLGLFVCTGLSVFVGYGCTKFLSQQILDTLSAAIFLSYAAVTFWELRTAEADSERLVEEASNDVVRMLSSESLANAEAEDIQYGSINSPMRDLTKEFDRVEGNTPPPRPKTVIISDTFKLAAIVWTVAVSEFVGEIGDRTSIAVILLTTIYPWQEVYFFAMLAFALVTAIAIVAGKFCSKFLSERSIGITSGTAFLIFGLLALANAITERKIY
eukprot:gene6614-13397_t